MIGQPIAPGGQDGGAMAVIAALLEQRTGQQIAANRAWRLETSLKSVLRDLDLASLDALVAALVTTRDAALSDRVVDALLNQESSFFRDATVLDLVANAAVARVQDSPGRKLRIWSAGCSNGQEPLSLAMLFTERGIAAETELLATDVSPAAIGRGRAARFSQFEIQRGLSIRRMVKWFEADGVDWVADRQLAGRIQYRRHNLVTDAPPPGGFDIVLCRNVLLYFSPAVRRQVLDGLARAVRPGGLLVLGAGETVIGNTEAFVPSKDWRGCYRPATAPAAASAVATAR
jgi:chemotaxis protein methyltransferase CheR